MSDKTATTRSGVAPHGLRAATEFLEGHGVRFEVVEHPTTDTAASEARAAHEAPQRTAKTVVVREGDEVWIIAVVPADRRLDLVKLREVLGADAPLALAEEDAIAERFPEVQVGAIPPFGPALVNATVVDERLLEHDEVLCAGGDHRHGIRLDPKAVVRLADAKVADISQDW